MATVLVTDGEQRAALAAVRSLGRAGHRVLVSSSEERPLAGGSRHTRSALRMPSPKVSPEEYAEEVARLVDRAGVDVVIPATEPSMLVLLPRRRELEPATVPFGTIEAFRALSDKAEMTRRAREIGLAVPGQEVLASPSTSVPEEIAFPLVVKPSRSVVMEEGLMREQVVRHVHAPEELRGFLSGLPATAFPVLLQERIHGPGTGIFLLRWQGETRAVFAHRRLREKPPSGGVSVYRESVAAEPELVARSEELLERVSWEGVAMVEFKRDRESGTPYLMEVNARLWGSLQLAVDAGVDFPRLLVEAALGGRAEDRPRYREGVRCRWWWGDVDHLIARLRGEAPGDTQAHAVRRLEAVAAFLVPWRPGDRFEVLKLHDPGPFLRESASWIMDAVGRGDSS